VELEREREVILEEIRMGQDDPSRKVFQQTMATLFQEHPYRRPIIGFEKTIQSIQRDQMVSFFKKWYVPNRATLVAVGDFGLQKMEEKVREAFKVSYPQRLVFLQGLRRRKKGISPCRVRREFQGNLSSDGCSIPSVKHEDTPALDALSHILGGGEASRLIQKVKLEEGW